MSATVIAAGGDKNFTWEDIVVGATEKSSIYRVSADEMMDFARRYDPLPIHVDAQAAAASLFGSLTASGVHMLAIRMRLLHDFAYGGGVIAAIGLDDVRYLAPLRAEQECQVQIKFLEKRPSSKRADRGIAVIEMIMFADGVPVLSLKDIALMRRRADGAVGSSA